MSAPSEACRLQSVKNPTYTKSSRQYITYGALMEVTKSMKPPDRKYRSATQVNVLSPETTDIGEADSFHMLEGSRFHSANSKEYISSPGV